MLCVLGGPTSCKRSVIVNVVLRCVPRITGLHYTNTRYAFWDISPTTRLSQIVGPTMRVQMLWDQPLVLYPTSYERGVVVIVILRCVPRITRSKKSYKTFKDKSGHTPLTKGGVHMLWDPPLVKKT